MKGVDVVVLASGADTALAAAHIAGLDASGVLVEVDDATWTPEGLLALSRAAAANPGVRNLGVRFALHDAAASRPTDGLDAEPVPAAPDGAQCLADGLGSGLRGARLTDIGQLADDSAQAAHLLSQPSELLFLVGHGNGLDLGVGMLSLCRRQALGTNGDPRVFPCFHGEPCCRPGGAHMDAASLRARRIIAATCWGLYPGGGHFAPATNPGRAWLADEAVEAVLTTVRVTIFHGPDLGLLYYLANSGLPFGEVANEVNRYRMRAGQEADFLCFGNPQSRLSAGVADVPSVWSDACAEVELPGGCGDVALRVPAHEEGVGRYVLLDGEAAPWLSGAFDLHRTIYLTSRLTGPGAPMRLRCSLHAALPGCGADHARLEAGAAVVTALLSSIAPRVDTAAPQLRAATDTAGRVQAMLADWPLEGMPYGSCLRRDDVDRLSGGLERLLAQLSGELVGLFAAQAPARGGNHMRSAWLVRARFDGESRHAGRCAYCGGVIDGARFVLPGPHRPMRSVSHCQFCGPVCDGDPELAASLAGPQSGRRGEGMRYAVTVTNPHGLKLEAHLYVGLEGFDRGWSPMPGTVRCTLAPGATARLEASLPVPDDWPPGVCHVSAVLALGTGVNYLRRPVLIHASSAGELSKLVTSA